MHDNKLEDEAIHTCTACSCEFSDDEGGVVGDFGMLPMAFCPTCLSCIYSMFDFLEPWNGISDKEIQNASKEYSDKLPDLTKENFFSLGAGWAESLLKERNGRD